MGRIIITDRNTEKNELDLIFSNYLDYKNISLDILDNVQETFPWLYAKVSHEFHCITFIFPEKSEQKTQVKRNLKDLCEFYFDYDKEVEENNEITIDY